MKTYRHFIQVPFYDVDAMRIVWHGHYAKYFEEARCGFFESLGMAYGEMEAAGFLLPVVDLGVKFIRPCVFGQRISIDVADADPENCNLLELSYLVADAKTGAILCKGRTRHAAVDSRTRKALFELPAEFLRRLRAQ